MKQHTVQSGDQRASQPDVETLEATRLKVRELLHSSEAFNSLPAEERRAIAQNMVHVGSYMANPDGILKSDDAPQPLAQSQARDFSRGRARCGKARVWRPWICR